jgi:TolB-like protein
VSQSSKAVFLSYASQDAEAARRICEALQARGIEVWFDQSELRGGDAWDQKIRHQIKDCALFIPIISSHTQARLEGYFRLEWRLADQRTYLMGRNRAFIVPVCIDDTPDADADVPDSFAAVQWTRSRAGASPALVERVAHLLSVDKSSASPSIRPQAVATLALETAFKPGDKPRSNLWQSRAAWLLPAIAVIIVVGYLIAARYQLPKHAAPSAVPPAQVSSAASDAAGAVPDKSIAVLPFADLSEKKDQEYFSDGLSEELIDLLAKVPDLRVPARTSSFSFKGKSDDIASIAAKLRVAQILEGSVRKAGHTIRVSAQLVRADNGYQLWSETYDRDLKDVFKVQDEIAGAVVAALKLKLAPGPAASSSHHTSNTDAYNQYLLGRQFADGGTTDNYRRAIQDFRNAIALDPAYAAAYAGLAWAQARLSDQLGDAPEQQRAAEAADKAIALGPQQADGYEMRGYLRYSFWWDWGGALADYQKALALDPSDSTLQRRYGILLGSVGRTSEGIAAIKRATELDPLSSPAWSNLGLHLIAGRQFPAAHEALRRALEIQPGHTYALNDLATLQLLEGDAAQALATFRQVGVEGLRLSGVAIAEHSLGHAKESQQALDQLIAGHAKSSAYQIGEVYAWRGDKQQAFEWLDRAYQQRDGGLADIKEDLLMASLVGDARYAALLRKMNLPQ